MTKPVTRKMAVDCLLWYVQQFGSMVRIDAGDHESLAIRCYICGEKIMPGQVVQFDHIHADVHKGPHEYQNLRPVHYDPCHKAKTKRDIQANAKVKRLRGETKGRPKRNWGKGRKLKSRGFQKGHRPMRGR